METELLFAKQPFCYESHHFWIMSYGNRELSYPKRQSKRPLKFWSLLLGISLVPYFSCQNSRDDSWLQANQSAFPSHAYIDSSHFLVFDTHFLEKKIVLVDVMTYDSKMSVCSTLSREKRLDSEDLCFTMLHQVFCACVSWQVWITNGNAGTNFTYS